MTIQRIETAASDFLYRPTLRPAYSGGMPPGVKWEYVEAPFDLHGKRADIPASKHRYGLVKTSRELTADEIEHFDLEPM